VLGYSGYERGKGWLHKRISFSTLFNSLRYLVNEQVVFSPL
jgi:hypothetical protein